MATRVRDVPATEEQESHWYGYWCGAGAYDQPQRFPQGGDLLGDPTIRKALDRAVADGKVAILHENSRVLYVGKVPGTYRGLAHLLVPNASTTIVDNLFTTPDARGALTILMGELMTHFDNEEEITRDPSLFLAYNRLASVLGDDDEDDEGIAMARRALGQED